MKINILVMLLGVLIIATACTSTQTPIEKETNTNTNTQVTSYSLTDVSLHNSKEDCWTIIHDKVYDITDYISKHPGGDAILEGCGKDATTLFETRPMGSGTPHSQKARDNLVNFYIGDLK